MAPDPRNHRSKLCKCMSVVLYTDTIARNLDLLCSVKYKNNLPDIPFDPKFLPYPFDSQRYICAIYSKLALAQTIAKYDK